MPRIQRLLVGLAIAATAMSSVAAKSLDYDIQLETILNPAEGGGWFQPRPAVIPGFTEQGRPAVVMVAMQVLGSDYFTGLSSMRSLDLGKTWSTSSRAAGLAWRDVDDGTPVVHIGVCDFQLGWHAPSRRVLGIGHTVRYTEKGFAGYGYRRNVAYAVYDANDDTWSPWRELEFPGGVSAGNAELATVLARQDSQKNSDDPSPPVPLSKRERGDGRFFHNGAHGQWIVEDDGSILLPIYAVAKGEPCNYRGNVVRCRFDGQTLRYVEEGREMTVPQKRGLYETSITKYQGRYYLTMRNDERGYVAMGEDGLNFGPVKPWTFDDGSELGSYNTQQKWVTHSKGLFLVYTRRGAGNDEVFRHRAPLFMAQVDPARLCVLRDTERIVVPKQGKAAFGNFDATNINENETWITVGGGGPAYCAQIVWAEPNKLVAKSTTKKPNVMKSDDIKPEVKRIWSEAPHSAFTDLIRHQNRFYCTFREGSGHVPGKSGHNGTIRVIASDDGCTWRSVASIAEEGVDLRDPKLSVTPDGRMMVLIGGSYYDQGKLLKRQPRVVFLKNERLTTAQPVPLAIDPRISNEYDWLWRVTWHEGVGYGVVYQPKDDPWKSHLVKTGGGVKYDLVTTLNLPGKPNESTVRFLPDGRMLIVVRNEDGKSRGHLGISVSPFKEWSWCDINAKLGGPNVIPLPSGKLVLGTRNYGKVCRTAIGPLTLNGRFSPNVVLPSGGDTSYPGLVVYDNKLWVSYYSSHEDRTAIYMATIPLSMFEDKWSDASRK